MDIQNPADVAVAAFFMVITKGGSITQALVDLYESGFENGKESILEDPETHGLIGRVA